MGFCKIPGESLLSKACSFQPQNLVKKTPHVGGQGDQGSSDALSWVCEPAWALHLAA